MCRWLAYVGDEIPLAALVTRPDHSLLDQSLLARQLFLPGHAIATQFRHDAFPTNGDGFGLAFRGRGGTLGQFREITPAWDSANLRSLADHVVSPCFLAHVRAAPGGTISEQNCHPFVHGGWMFQHNGEIGGFRELKRELTMDVDPALYPFIQGNGDSELCFFLALTYGLAEDPVRALARMVDRVERARADRGVRAPFRATMAASDGERLICLRTSSRPETSDAPAGMRSPSLFHAAGALRLRMHAGRDADHPGAERADLESLPANARLVASEPLDLDYSTKTWHEVPDRSILVVRAGEDPALVALDDVAR